jgi:hypothetical protein
MAAPLKAAYSPVAFATAKADLEEYECVAHEVKRKMRFN